MTFTSWPFKSAITLGRQYSLNSANFSFRLILLATRTPSQTRKLGSRERQYSPCAVQYREQVALRRYDRNRGDERTLRLLGAGDAVALDFLRHGLPWAGLETVA